MPSRDRKNSTAYVYARLVVSAPRSQADGHRVPEGRIKMISIITTPHHKIEFILTVPSRSLWPWHRERREKSRQRLHTKTLTNGPVDEEENIGV